MLKAWVGGRSRDLLCAVGVSLALAACGISIGEPDGADPVGDADASLPDGSPACETTLTGVVVAPDGATPLPGAVVSAPGTGLKPATAAADGRFELPGLLLAVELEDQAVHLAVKSGGFELDTRVAVAAPCNRRQLPAPLALAGDTMPGGRSPRIAAVTGQYDAVECQARGLGINTVDIYDGFDNGGDGTRAAIAEAAALFEERGRLLSYDTVIVNSSRDRYQFLLDRSDVRANLLAFLEGGGRLIVTDWAYDWVEQLSALAPRIDFGPGASGNGPEQPNTAQIGDPGTVDARVESPVVNAWADAALPAGTDREIQYRLGGWAMQRSVASGTENQVLLSANVRGINLSGRLPVLTRLDYQTCGSVFVSTFAARGRPESEEPFPDYCTGPTGFQERMLQYTLIAPGRCDNR